MSYPNDTDTDFDATESGNTPENQPQEPTNYDERESDPEPFVEDGFANGAAVHDKDHRGGPNQAGDGVVLATQDTDDGKFVTVGRFASIERVSVDSLNLGSSTTFEQ